MEQIQLTALLELSLIFHPHKFLKQQASLTKLSVIADGCLEQGP